MKVIAINDAPLPQNMRFFERRSYYVGDIFEVYDKSRCGNDYLIIYNHKLEVNMDVNPDNFITLEEWRERKLTELGI